MLLKSDQSLISEEFDFVLIDPILKMANNLIDKPKYCYPSAGKDSKKLLRLIVGTEEFIKDNGYTPPYWQLVRLAENAKEGR